MKIEERSESPKVRNVLKREKYEILALKNDSWYIQWLRSKGNRLFDLEN